jgi:hypothetical protein
MAKDPKDYKAEEDVERAFYLVSAAHLMRDYLGTAALAASFVKELVAMNTRQAERDAKETADRVKEEAAKASAAAASESDESPPTRAARSR